MMTSFSRADAKSARRSGQERGPGRLLELLDKAYDAPEAPERFDDLMEAAKQYFFADENGRLAPDLPRLAGFDARLAPHIARIQKLLDRAADPERYKALALKAAKGFNAAIVERVVAARSGA